MRSLKAELAKLLSEAIKKTLECPVIPEDVEQSLEFPPEEKFGDLSTSVVLRLSKQARKPSAALAQAIHKNLTAILKKSPLGERVEKVTAEGPGFINFHFSHKELTAVLSRIEDEGRDFGKPAPIQPKNILLEFVSANPTGPLTVAHGRQAALGDSLARILSFCGHKVTKEYYNNDEGVQIDTLGKSTELWYRKKALNKNVEFPENYYRGAYLEDTTVRLIEARGAILETLDEENRIRECAAFAKKDILEGIQKDLSDFGVFFDRYYSQAELAASGKVEKTLEELKKRNHVYEKDGAVWFRSTDFGDDKDRVLIKSDKTYTYLTPDISYHHEKFERGFDELINIWGPDHHGYIPRLKASQEALGHDAKRIHILIAQLVTLYEGKKQVRMSTRAGEFVTLREVMDEVGTDAGRFFFLMRKFDAHLDFDLALAKSQTPENPVFYIQYAHARIESIKKSASDDRPSKAKISASGLSRLASFSEIRLLRLLSHFEDAISAAGRTLEPYRLLPYLQELAAAFHKFYNDHRVISDDVELTHARLILVSSTQQVIRQGLELLGVSAPLKM